MSTSVLSVLIVLFYLFIKVLPVWQKKRYYIEIKQSNGLLCMLNVELEIFRGTSLLSYIRRIQ